MVKELSIPTPGRGLHLITDEIEAVVRESGVAEGLCTVLIRPPSRRRRRETPARTSRTSASLFIAILAPQAAADRLETFRAGSHY